MVCTNMNLKKSDTFKQVIFDPEHRPVCFFFLLPRICSNVFFILVTCYEGLISRHLKARRQGYEKKAFIVKGWEQKEMQAWDSLLRLRLGLYAGKSGGFKVEKKG